MCVAIICETAKPELPMLLEAERSNKDGGGVAWIENKMVRFKKGLTALEIMRILDTVKLPCFVHFRLATVGGSVGILCHPFAIRKDGRNVLEGKAEAVLMHNGHWSGWQEALRSSVIRGSRVLECGPWSDSRAMAYLAAHHGEAILETITGDKIAVLEKSGSIGHYGFWHEKDGMIFSNTSLIEEKKPWYHGAAPGYSMAPKDGALVAVGSPLSKKKRKKEEKLARLAGQHDIKTCNRTISNCRLCSYKLQRPWYPTIPSGPAKPSTSKHEFWDCGLALVDCRDCTQLLKENPSLWDEIERPSVAGLLDGPTMADMKQDQEKIEELQKDGTLNKSGME